MPSALPKKASQRAALRTANTPAEHPQTFTALSERFERFAQHVGAATVYLIDTSGTKEETTRQVLEVYKQLRAEAG